MNKYLEKIALNRYEKHLWEGGATGSNGPASNINLAKKRIEHAKHLDDSKTKAKLNPSSRPEYVEYLQSRKKDIVSLNRHPSVNLLGKGKDSLTREPGHYSTINEERKRGEFRTSNKPGVPSSKFVIGKPVIERSVKPAESLLSKAKSLLGNKKVLAGGLVAGAVGLGAGAAYAATRHSKDKSENKA